MSQVPIRIPLMRSTFFDEKRTKERLAAFIQTAPRLSMDSECAAFEKAFAAYQKRTFAVLVSNGSAANLGLIQSLLNTGQLQRGDKVGISAVTWATNVMPLMQLGLIPVAMDCSLAHLNVTSEEVSKYVKGLRAIFLTNVLSFCGDIDVIRGICADNDVLLLEDNCESLGTKYKGTLLGNFGLASTFSFFVGHHLSTIEGGMICTDNETLYHMLLMVRGHGWDRNLPATLQKSLRSAHGIDDFHGRYTFYEQAYNIRPTEITGFLGNLQLPMLEETFVKRENNFRRFHTSVLSRPDLYLPLSIDPIERLPNFAMPIITQSPSHLLAAIKRFNAAGVEIRPVIAGNITAHPFWKKNQPKAECPNADIVHTQGFYMPNNADLTEDEVQLLCSLIEQE